MVEDVGLLLRHEQHHLGGGVDHVAHDGESAHPVQVLRVDVGEMDEVFVLNAGSSSMPRSPRSAAFAVRTVIIGVGCSTPFVTTRTEPFFCAMKMRPPGANRNAVGVSRAADNQRPVKAGGRRRRWMATS